MFCGECGTKNSKGNKFCSNCGSKLETGEEVTEIEESKKEEKMKTKSTKSTKKKKTIIVLLILALALGGGYYYGDMITSPEEVADRYFDAIEDENYSYIYNMMNLEENDFTTLEKFESMHEDTGGVSFDIIDVKEKSKSADVEYEIDYGSAEYEDELTLVKDGKKYFIFDNWVVEDLKEDLIESNYKVVVLKDSIVTIDGIKLDDYYSEEESTDEEDVYIIKEMFNATYEIEVVSPIGLTVKEEIKPISDEEYRISSFSIDDMSEEEQEKIADSTMNILQDLYDNAIDEVDFNTLKDTYEKDGTDIDELEDDYNDLVEDLNGSTKLDEIKFTDVELSTIKITDEGEILVTVKADYDYKISYEDIFSDEEESHEDSKSNAYESIYIKYIDGEYVLAGIDNVSVYFSRY